MAYFVSYSKTGSDAREGLSPLPPFPPYAVPASRHPAIDNTHPSQEFDDDDEAKQQSKARRSSPSSTPPRLKSRRPTPFVRGNHIPHTCICTSVQLLKIASRYHLLGSSHLWVFASLVRSTVQSSCSLSAARDRTRIRGPHYLDFKRLVTSD
jgi:hypothetical protein